MIFYEFLFACTQKSLSEKRSNLKGKDLLTLRAKSFSFRADLFFRRETKHSWKELPPLKVQRISFPDWSFGVLRPFQHYFSHIETMEKCLWKALCKEALYVVYQTADLLRGTDRSLGEATLLTLFWLPSENGTTIKGKNLEQMLSFSRRPLFFPVFFFFFFLFFCFFVLFSLFFFCLFFFLPMGTCRAPSVYLTTTFLGGRFSSKSG